MEALAPTELARRIAAASAKGGELGLVLLDVREPDEIELCPFPGAVAIPLGELSVRHIELDPDAPTVCICHHGIRSASAAVGLERLGFETLYNLSGGVERWARDVDASMPRY